MRLHVLRCDLHLAQLRTRMPFRYGIATMTDVPQIYLRLWLEIDGQFVECGSASDCLPPKWFTKDAAKAVDVEIAEMLHTIRNARAISLGVNGESVFAIWQQVYNAQAAWAKANAVPPLLAHFGTSLVERALIEAFCRFEQRPFWELLQENAFGSDLGAIHSELSRHHPSDFLPPRPLDLIIVRHTVGLGDPLADGDIADEERLKDGLPQSLKACIQRYGLRHFKIKVSGNCADDAQRLRKIADLVEGDFRFSLDGNEQFHTASEFRHYWHELQSDSRLLALFNHLLFVEQPIHRSTALSQETGSVLLGWKDRPPIIIDESDGALEDLEVALALGYSGTSHKNCKGVFKGIAHRCLIEHRARTNPDGPWLMSGEDLCNVGPVAPQQDLAVMAALGIKSVERNGHHYHAGLSQYPKAIQEAVLQHHPDLYRLTQQGWPALCLSNGEVALKSVNRAPFGVGFQMDVSVFAET
jgi:L-alanine-DL-glutamate epimerase-like enolase superfamily enzyme